MNIDYFIADFFIMRSGVQMLQHHIIAFNNANSVDTEVLEKVLLNHVHRNGLIHAYLLGSVIGSYRPPCKGVGIAKDSALLLQRRCKGVGVAVAKVLLLQSEQELHFTI